MAKYIFVTGGVVSSLGKGITAASLGTLLKNEGLKVTILKIDPYLNVDPGTMSPFQHGEVYVTDDGAETDLDLGYYERYLDEDFSQDNNFTTGVIYNHVIGKERRGEFLGSTVQVIPHVTDEIKKRIKKLGVGNDVVITEIGGTTGDIEGLPFLEAIRQFKQDVGQDNVCYIHVTLVPYIRAAEEMKTKPTQQSVAKLREIGIDPQIIVCRTEKVINKDLRRKIALFCSVPENAVIEEKDVSTTIYEVPIMFHKAKLDNLVMKILKLKKKRNGGSILKKFEDLLYRMKRCKKIIPIAVAGKYTQLKDAYKSIWEALNHAGTANGVKLDICYVDVESKNLKKELAKVKGILIPGGFGERGVQGKINVVQYARENKIPFFGLCLGMQCVVIEFARNVCGMKKANSIEFDPKTPYPVIDMMEAQKKIINMGGTMRLGKYPCELKSNTLAMRAYKQKSISERHRHRYELNNVFREKLESKGLIISGEYKKGKLAEIVELKNHPWFLAVQFHPEFKSRPIHPHPLFVDFIKAAKKIVNK